MSSLLLVCVVLVPGAISFLIAGRRDGGRLSALLGLAGILFLAVLWQIDEAIPFAGIGDDKDYFTASKQTFNNLNDWIDVRRYKRTHEQAGYPLLLAWVHQLAGGSLYHRKAVNVFFFLMLALVWFGIGKHIGGRRLAFVSATGVLLATPLWFYWIFLFKDMVITFLQSMFILGLVKSRSPRSVAGGYGLIALSTVLTIPFRSKLALVNLVTLAGSTLLRTGSRQSWKTSFLKVVMAAGIVLSILIVGTNPEILQRLGVAGEHRTLDVESVQAEVERKGGSRSAHFTSTLMFPLLYLVGEVAAFNPSSWGNLQAPLIRGLSMVPWIYVGVPLFLTGTWMIVRQRKSQDGVGQIAASLQTKPQADSIQSSRGDLFVLLLFVLIYAGVAWGSADTTRWRMPAIPPMVAIAGYAWITLSRQQRLQLLLSWALLLSFSFMGYYVIIK
jgi:hypothetical protein